MADHDFSDAHIDINLRLTKENFYTDPQVLAYNLKTIKTAFTGASVIAFALFAFYAATTFELRGEVGSDAFWQLFLDLFFIIVPLCIILIALSVDGCAKCFPAIVLINAYISFFAFIHLFVRDQAFDWLLYMIFFYLLAVIIVAPIIQFYIFVVSCIFFLALIDYYLIDSGISLEDAVVLNAQLITLGVTTLIVAFRIQVNSYKTLKALVRLHKLSLLDSLTEAFNRGAWHQKLQQEYIRASQGISQLSIILLDIDHFKRVNDQYGHQVGDVVIQTVVQICQQSIRHNDVIGRLGGEEFGILLPNASLENSVKVAHRILEDMRDFQFDFAQEKFGVTVSLGVGVYNSQLDDSEQLFKQADDALYQAKNNGRNHYVVALHG